MLLTAPGSWIFSDTVTSPSGSGTPLSAKLMLRPTIRHPDLTSVFAQVDQGAMHFKLLRDTDGMPVDALHVHGHAAREDSIMLEKAIWGRWAPPPSYPVRSGCSATRRAATRWRSPARGFAPHGGSTPGNVEPTA